MQNMVRTTSVRQVTLALGPFRAVYPGHARVHARVPAKVAARMKMASTIVEVAAVIREKVYAALSELSQGGGATDDPAAA